MAMNLLRYCGCYLPKVSVGVLVSVLSSENKLHNTGEFNSTMHNIPLMVGCTADTGLLPRDVLDSALVVTSFPNNTKFMKHLSNRNPCTHSL